MTTQQPEALRLANVCSNLTRYSMDAHLIAAELLRQHAENGTLRTGYAAARLEIESLNAQLVERAKEHADELTVAYMCGASREKELAAQQPGAAYAVLPEYGINTASHAHFRVLGFTADQMRAFADATHALRASHGQASSQAGEYPALVCDYCGALTPDPWHSSGMLHGKMSKHIHSCDACAARGVAKAQDTPAYSPAQSDL